MRVWEEYALSRLRGHSVDERIQLWAPGLAIAFAHLVSHLGRVADGDGLAGLRDRILDGLWGVK